MSWQWMVLLTINLILIFTIIFVDHKKSGEAVLWVLVLILLPVVGILFYLSFGSTIGIRLTYKIKSHRLSQEYRSFWLDELESVKNKKIPLPCGSDTGMQDLILFNLNYCESLLCEKNEVDILTDGREKYRLLFEDIENARESIHIVYYGIHRDTIGLALVELLRKKAKQGVKVRLMYDGVGSFGTPKKMFAPLRRAGGMVKKIKPYLTHFRNHRKIVVIDGKIAYTGGMNIGEKYAGMDRVKTPWRDTQIRVLGDAVYLLQYYFLYDWFFVHPLSKVGLYDDELTALFPSHTVASELPCQVIASGVDTDKEFIRMSYLKLIASAKKKILLQTPYFIPDSTILDALKIAAASGVSIEIMLPGVKSSFFLQPVTNHYIAELLEYGVKVYHYHGYLHAKTLSIDDCVTVIGSVNMDIRSLSVDDEICTVFYSSAFAKRHEEQFALDRQNSDLLDNAAFLKRGMLQKAVERFFLLFAPLM